MANTTEVKIGETLDIHFNRIEDETPIPIGNAVVTSTFSHKKFGSWDMTVEVLNADEGELRLSLPAAVTATMFEGDYIWEITYTYPDRVEKFPKRNDTIIFEMVKGA